MTYRVLAHDVYLYGYTEARAGQSVLVEEDRGDELTVYHEQIDWTFVVQADDLEPVEDDNKDKDQ